MATTPRGERRTMISGETRISYSTKETAQLIREALKRAFPDFRFSVTTSYASMTSSTNVSWTDGPTEPEVKHITDQFSSKTFDGMTDSTHYHEQTIDGQRVSYSGWIYTKRSYSVALLEKALARFQTMRAEYGLPAANLLIKANGSYPFVDGPDANTEAGIHTPGHRWTVRYCSDAVTTIAYTLRPNGCRIIVKR